MDSRPPKRRRSAREPQDSSNSRATPVVLSSRPKSSKTRPSPAPSTRHSSPSLSPSKPTDAPNQSKSTSKSLHNFFQPATEGQRWASQKFESKRPLPSVSESLDADEIEDDYDSYDEIFTQHIASQSFNYAPKSDTSNSSNHGQRSLPPKQKTTSAHRTNQPSKRFLMPPESKDQPRIRSKSPHITEEVDSRPWAQRFGPETLDELAVHKRKVADVQKWLEDVFAGRCKQVSQAVLSTGTSVAWRRAYNDAQVLF